MDYKPLSDYPKPAPLSQDFLVIGAPNKTVAKTVALYLRQVLALLEVKMAWSHVDLRNELLETVDGRHFDVGYLDGVRVIDAVTDVAFGHFNHLRVPVECKAPLED